MELDVTLWMSIDGEPYLVEVLDNSPALHAIELTALKDNGERNLNRSYVAEADPFADPRYSLKDGRSCTCKSFRYGRDREGFEGCKHLVALKMAGLLKGEEIIRTRPIESTRDSEPEGVPVY